MNGKHRPETIAFGVGMEIAGRKSVAMVHGQSNDKGLARPRLDPKPKKLGRGDLPLRPFLSGPPARPLTAPFYVKACVQKPRAAIPVCHGHGRGALRPILEAPRTLELGPGPRPVSLAARPSPSSV